MRKGYYISVSACVVALAGVIYKYRSLHREPTYEGHPASYWFWPGGLKQQEAFHSMGSNAVPYLLGQLNHRESFLARCYRDNFVRLPAWYKQRVSWPQGDFNRHLEALFILGALESSAESATPDLIRTFKDPNPRIRATAAFALARIGPPAKTALPALYEIAKATNEPNFSVRWNAAQAIWKIDHQCDILVSCSLEALNSTDESSRWEALSNLGACGPSSKPAVPALIEILARDKSERFRAKAATTLGRIGPDASAAIPALQEALKDEYLNVRDTAREALREIQRN